MVWFLVDDNLALHRKAIEAGNAALGLWTRCGAWSAGNLTDGYVPSNVARQFGSQNQINNLLKAGLWSRVTSGYQFHDWNDHQPTAEQVKQRRDAMRERQQRKRKNAKSGTDVTRDVTQSPHARGRPSPLQDLGSLPHQGDGAAARPPPARCCQCEKNDGYRQNGLVCDHIDRTKIVANGSAAVREAFNEAKAGKAQQMKQINNTMFDEPRCTCGHVLSYHEHGAQLDPYYACDYGRCGCADFNEDLTEPMFEVNQ